MGIFPGRHFPVTSFSVGSTVVLPLRGELPRSGGNNDRAGRAGQSHHDLPLGPEIRP